VRTSSGDRSSALWGSGKNGENRSNTLWGKGPRQVALVMSAVFVLGAPLLASASTQQTARPAPEAAITHRLLAQASAHASARIRVIVQSSHGIKAAESAFHGVGSIRRRLPLIDGVAGVLPAARLSRLAHVPGLTVTPDTPVRLTGAFSSAQVWPLAHGFQTLWGAQAWSAPQSPTIAVVDSGIDTTRPDFGSRVVKQVELCSLAPCSSGGDAYGHGTFVAGIAAGSASGYAGGAPSAKLVSLHVMNDNGQAATSDVISAAQWILANKSTYNIRVANFSLHSSTPSNFTRDPLDQAVEKLWFSGVVVVTAAGNNAADGAANGVHYAPANDPFVVTVGASDFHGTNLATDDTIAPWSSWGYTYDGFAKPELSASGRYMVAAIPPSSTLAAARAANVVAPGYIRLSGTSFAAPVVAAAAAQILARHGSWTPDQVKGALMQTARPLPLVLNASDGVGELNAQAAAAALSPPNPNEALDRFLVADPSGGSTFDGASWTAAAHNDVSWDAVSWGDSAWSSAAVSWGDVSWNDVSWADVSSSSVSWADVSWGDIADE
jgi:serine protease AprX